MQQSTAPAEAGRPTLLSRLPGPVAQAAAGWRGLLLCLLIAGASGFVADNYGGPTVLYALLLGLACTFLADDPRIRPGLDVASRGLLRLGVALLGARIAAEQVAELGAGALLTVAAAMAFTFLVAVPAARALGFGRDFALLSATATAVCGVSAALTAGSILPKTERSDRDTAFVALAVTLLSTVAMVLYPILAPALTPEPLGQGVFIGASIHDVAQVVAAGYLIGEAEGDAAVITKLARVAMLVPVSIALSVHVGMRMEAAAAAGGGRKSVLSLLKLPWFLVAFVVLAALNSLHVLPAGAGEALSPLSRGLLVVAIAAIGIKTGVRRMVDMGWRATALLVVLTIAIAAAAAAGVRISL